MSDKKPPLCHGCGAGLGEYHSLHDGRCRECERNYLKADRYRLKEILDACHHAIGEDEASDDDSLAETIQEIISDREGRIAELEAEKRSIRCTNCAIIESANNKLWRRIDELDAERSRLSDMGEKQDKCLKDWMEDDAERDAEEDIKDRRIGELEAEAVKLKAAAKNLQRCLKPCTCEGGRADIAAALEYAESVLK